MGFALDNKLLIISGALDELHRLYLVDLIMCSRHPEPVVRMSAVRRIQVKSRPRWPGKEARPVRSATPEEAAGDCFPDARTVVIIPGYGMAVAQAQHKIRELHDALVKRGARRENSLSTPLPGQYAEATWNVLLAEAGCSLRTKLIEMEEINGEMAMTDVTLIVGANDIVNPAAMNDPTSPIAGMPILDGTISRER